MRAITNSTGRLGGGIQRWQAKVSESLRLPSFGTAGPLHVVRRETQCPLRVRRSETPLVFTEDSLGVIEEFRAGGRAASGGIAGVATQRMSPASRFRRTQARERGRISRVRFPRSRAGSSSI
jgi:hypothetical protein